MSIFAPLLEAQQRAEAQRIPAAYSAPIYGHEHSGYGHGQPPVSFIEHNFPELH